MTSRSTTNASLTMRPDGILHIVFDFEELPSPESVDEFVTIHQELVGIDVPPVIIELVEIPYIDRSIRQLFMEKIAPPPCRAVVTTDQALLTMFRTFQMIDAADVPTEVVPTVEAAVSWIQAQTGSA
ncbi:MAG: hypothetical protein HKN95_10160 [Acidimicrobiia bacterium]|nr:hypothetical protein [Acidimicrobiia bacterium]